MNIADTLILANLATISLVLTKLSGELHHASVVFFYVSGSTLTSLPLLGLIGIVITRWSGKKQSCHTAKGCYIHTDNMDTMT